MAPSPETPECSLNFCTTCAKSLFAKKPKLPLFAGANGFFNGHYKDDFGLNDLNPIEQLAVSAIRLVGSVIKLTKHPFSQRALTSHIIGFMQDPTSIIRDTSLPLDPDALPQFIQVMFVQPGRKSHDADATATNEATGMI